MGLEKSRPFVFFFYLAKIAYSIMRDIIERMITTRCGLALVVETRNAENIGDKATVKKRNGTGIDESNVVISIYFFLLPRKNCIFYNEN